MKIYLSSTYEDLKEYRRAVFEALRKGGHEVIAMEDYVAADRRPVDKCLDDVRSADVYVGVFALRYGYVPPADHGNPDGLSITELEYRAAQERKGVTCLLYVLDEKHAWPRTFDDAHTGDNDTGQKIARLLAYLRTEKLAPSFTTEYQLASEVQAAVSKLEKESPADDASGTEPAAADLAWDVDRLRSPYPGLMHFTRRYAPVFFGREADIRAILDRLVSPDGRFLIISGDSGCGKSSLVDAGVLPRLEEAVFSGERSCRAVYMIPSRGNDPFDALLRALHSCAEAAGLNPVEKATRLVAEPERLPDLLRTIVDKGLDGDELVLFLDQSEELFTRGADAQDDSDAANSDAFLSGLCQAAFDQTLRVIATIRSDFLHHCHRHPDLLSILRGPGHYPLGHTEPWMLRDMIAKPAEAAGLRIKEQLVDKLVADTGSEPGSLPLLAFVLERLYDERNGDELSETVYDKLGGIGGALSEYAAKVERELQKDLGAKAAERLPALFDRLLVVNVEGTATRRWARAANLTQDLEPIVDVLVRKRLLTKAGEGEQATVSVAHEKLFDAWPALSHWIAENEDELRILSLARIDARQWRAYKFGLAYLWHPDRLERLQQILERRPNQASDNLNEFAWPGERLVALLSRSDLSHEERLTAGKLMARCGDPRPGVGVDANGVPDIDWIPIRGGRIVLEEDAVEQSVGDFEIARYPVTVAQFQAFLDAEDGFSNEEWWTELKQQPPESPRWSEANGPREMVSWYDAVAFSHWLSQRLGYTVRLPTEFEWQQAATGGQAQREYPWGAWEEGRFNSAESGLNRTTSVGLYPHGTWEGGPEDMAGNVWEWCLNKYKEPADNEIDRSDDSRVLRGGSWSSYSDRCRATFRFSSHPDCLVDFLGFRLLRPPSPDH